MRDALGFIDPAVALRRLIPFFLRRLQFVGTRLPSIFLIG
jgi:hypothetical protein